MDLAADRPWIDTDRLLERISENTVAVVGVDLFGIRERWNRLDELSRSRGFALIQDAAQAFPSAPEQCEDLVADRVVLSFGRGKPLTMLYGGALLTKPPASAPAFGAALGIPTVRAEVSPTKLRSSCWLYNCIRRPSLFWWVSKIPALHVGRTTYSPLERIEWLDDSLEPFLDQAVTAFWNRSTSSQASLRTGVAEMSGQFIDLAAACGLPNDARLSRLPLLCSSIELRNRVLRACRGMGYYATAMYEHALPKWAGWDDRNIAAAFPNAVKFAERLVTLPIHDAIGDRDARTLVRCLQKIETDP